MNVKPYRFLLLLAILLLFGFLLALPIGDTPAQQQITIHSGDFSQIGGLSDVSSMTLGGSSPPPAPLARQDYIDIYAEANELLGVAVDYRQNQIQAIPKGMITVITHVLQNYKDFNSGVNFYQFCADYNMLEQTGECPGEVAPPEKQGDIHDKLKRAQGLFAVLRLEPNGIEIPKIDYAGEPILDEQKNPIFARVTDLGREGLLEATRELVSVHMIFGTEFQVDALDYRFGGDVFTADLILTQELCQLGADEGVPGLTCTGGYDYDGGALRQFLLALNVLSDTYNAEIGWPHKVYLADDFTNKEIELFSIASGRLIQVMDEIALRYRQVGEDERALEIYQTGARQQYMQSLALAQKAAETDTDFLNNGGWELLTNLGRMRAMTQTIYDGYNAFGYIDEYVPLQSYEKMRAFVQADLLRDATEDENEARAAQREFDTNATLVATELQNLRLTYGNSLLEICGASTDDYQTCNGGLMEQNFYAMKAASDRMGLVIQRLRDIPKRIKIEQDRAGKVINLTLRNGEQMAAISYAIGIENAYRMTESTVEATTDEWHNGVENRTTITVGSHMGIPPSFGVSVENSTSIFFGVSHSQTKTSSMSTVFDPEAEIIGYLTSLRDLQQAATEVGIIGANSQATIRTILLEQASLLIELDIAIAEYNRLAAEHNHLVEKYRNWLDLRSIAQENFLDSYLNNPAYRILRETLTIEASRSFSLAAQYAYLTAKALEYELLTPYLQMGDIYKARTADNIDNFLNDLETWKEGLGSPAEPVVYPISIAEDILGLSDENLDPEGNLSASQLAQLRYEAFQAFLNQNRTGGLVRFQFSTSILDDSIFSRNVWNHRITDAKGVTGTKGVAINVLTRQLGNAGTPEIRLTHDGHASYRTRDNRIVEYTPGNARPVGFQLPPGWNLDVGTAATIFASVNGNNLGNNVSGLYNLSVAASSWTLEIDMGSANNRDFDVTKLEDIIILMETSYYSLPRLEDFAAQDMARIAAEAEKARTASALDGQ